MCDRRRQAHLQALNGDICEAKLFQPCGEQVKLRQVFDNPSPAQFAVDALLLRAGEPFACDKAVRNRCRRTTLAHF